MALIHDKSLISPYIAQGITSGVITTPSGGTMAWGAAAEQLSASSGSQLSNTLQAGLGNLTQISSLAGIEELDPLRQVLPLSLSPEVHGAALRAGAPAVASQIVQNVVPPNAREAWETFSGISETFSGMFGGASRAQPQIFGREYQASLAAAIRAALASAYRRGLGTGVRGAISRATAARGRIYSRRRGARTFSFGGTLA